MLEEEELPGRGLIWLMLVAVARGVLVWVVRVCWLVLPGLVLCRGVIWLVVAVARGVLVWVVWVCWLVLPGLVLSRGVIWLVVAVARGVLVWVVWVCWLVLPGLSNLSRPSVRHVSREPGPPRRPPVDVANNLRPDQ